MANALGSSLRYICKEVDMRQQQGRRQTPSSTNRSIAVELDRYDDMFGVDAIDVDRSTAQRQSSSQYVENSNQSPSHTIPLQTEICVHVST